MGSSYWFDNINLVWSIVYILGVSGCDFLKNVFFCLKFFFTLKNSVDPDEMPHYAAFHLGLYCLLKYPLWGFTYMQKVKANSENSDQTVHLHSLI